MPTTSHQSPATSVPTYDITKPVAPATLSLAYVNEATKAVITPRASVELAKSGKLYVPTVRKVVKDLGERGMAAFIKAELVSLNIVLNLARPMTEPMIEQTAPLVVQHILEDDCDVTLADLRLIFDRAKKGTYGSYYGGIGCADIISWIDGYIAEKCSEYERWHQNQYAQPAAQRSYQSEGDERNAFREAMSHYLREQTKDEQP